MRELCVAVAVIVFAAEGGTRAIGGDANRAMMTPDRLQMGAFRFRSFHSNLHRDDVSLYALHDLLTRAQKRSRRLFQSVEGADYVMGMGRLGMIAGPEAQERRHSGLACRVEFP